MQCPRLVFAIIFIRYAHDQKIENPNNIKNILEHAIKPKGTNHELSTPF